MEDPCSVALLWMHQQQCGVLLNLECRERRSTWDWKCTWAAELAAKHSLFVLKEFAFPCLLLQCSTWYVFLFILGLGTSGKEGKKKFCLFFNQCALRFFKYLQNSVRIFLMLKSRSNKSAQGHYSPCRITVRITILHFFQAFNLIMFFLLLLFAMFRFAIKAV